MINGRDPLIFFTEKSETVRAIKRGGKEARSDLMRV